MILIKRWHNKEIIMHKIKTEKAIQIPAKPKSATIASSMVHGKKESRSPKPKSLSPVKKK